jgi:hypothetical protein
MARSSVAAAMSFSSHARRRVWVVDIEVGIDAFANLLAQLAHTFTARRGFSSNGGAQQSHHAVLFRELSLELARLIQLRVIANAFRQ